MQTNVIRIVAAVVDTRHLTLYKESGETVVIPQGDSRVRRIVDAATPMLIQQGYADVDIADVVENSYLEFEAQTNGVVKLFRIAKDKLASLFALGIANEVDASAPVEPVQLGEVPAVLQHTQSAVEEIMQHAVSVASPEFHEEGVAKQGNVVEENGQTIGKPTINTSTETIVAVVDGKIIPGMENIKTQFARAAKLGSTIGIENFLKRLGTVIEQRSHSVEDLLKFLERGDLPIADDGSILIYKVLNRKGDRTNGKYVDCHTGKVEQWVGSYVCMDASLVDPNRRNECSNGLHVARRGYVKEFPGSVCVMAKLAPEDVIAVPSYDANKMRVCGYHIIVELTDKQFSLLKSNRPLTEDEEGKRLLANAMSGKHVRKTHEVRIRGQKGTDIAVTTLVAEDTPVVKPKVSAPKEAEALANTVVEVAPPVNPNDVVKQVEQLSRKDIAAKMYADGDVVALKAYKKAAKVSWDKLGVPDPDVTPPVVKAKIVGKTTDSVLIDEISAQQGSPKERIQKLLSIGLTSIGVAQAIIELKKKSKKSWDVLGVSGEQVEQVMQLANYASK